MIKRALVAAIVVLTAFSLAATPAPPPPIRVHRAEGPITIDGRIDDAGWQTAAKIDTFYETSPGDNTPPAAKTTAWLTYDDRYFSIALPSHAPHPHKLPSPTLHPHQASGTDAT